MDKPKEQDIIEKFLANISYYIHLDGEHYEIFREVGLGKKFRWFPPCGEHKSPMLVVEPKRRCDLMILTEKSVWLIEAKRQLNCEAVGQVLLYRYLFIRECVRQEGNKIYADIFVNGDLVSLDVAGKDVKIGIIYGESDEDLEGLCEELGVHTILVKHL